MPATADSTHADRDFARTFGDSLEWVTDPSDPPDGADGDEDGDSSGQAAG